MWKIVKKISVGVITTILVLVLLFNIYNFVNLRIFKKDFTSIGGYALLEVVSGSMEPTIRIGDLIVIKTKNYEYRPNDIVTFRDENGSFVTHRIVAFHGEDMVTKGDHNNTEDRPIATKNIVGKYVFKIPKLGSFLSTLKNPIVSIMIFVIGLLLCYFASMKEEEEELREKDQKTYREFLKFKEEEEHPVTKEKGTRKKKTVSKEKENKKVLKTKKAKEVPDTKLGQEKIEKKTEKKKKNEKEKVSTKEKKSFKSVKDTGQQKKKKAIRATTGTVSKSEVSKTKSTSRKKTRA